MGQNGAGQWDKMVVFFPSKRTHDSIKQGHCRVRGGGGGAEGNIT